MMRLGLTGGIASGKSTIVRMLEELGAHIVDADRIAREVVEPGSPVLLQIVEYFGDSVLTKDRRLDRKSLGAIVFNQPEKRKQLEFIMHPPIRVEMRKQMDYWDKIDPKSLIVADIPLLFESELHTWFEEIMVIYVPRDVQITRLIAREGVTSEQAEQRLNAQMNIEEKKRRAQWVIDNTGTMEESRSQVLEFLQEKGRI